MSDECKYHPQLMESLGGLRSDVSWLKTAFWSIPASLLIIAGAVVSLFLSNERRITAIETQVASITQPAGEGYFIDHEKFSRKFGSPKK